MKKEELLLTTGLLLAGAIFADSGSAIDEQTNRKITNVVVSSNGATAIARGQGSQAVAGGISISGNQITLGSTTKDTGVKKIEQRTLPAYNAVEIKTFPGEVQLHVGKENSAVVTADSAVVSAISTTVKNSTLIVDLTENISTTMPMRLILSSKNIFSLVVNGVGDIRIDGINTDKFRLQINGSGSVVASGTVRELNAALTGSGDLKLADLIAHQCTVTLNGAGDATVHATHLLTAAINGAGDIIYYGNPSEVAKTVNGAGDIEPAAD